MKQLMRIYRSSRAPYGTSKFGGQLKDAKQKLVQSFREGPCELLEMLWPRIAEDLQIDPTELTLDKLDGFASA